MLLIGSLPHSLLATSDLMNEQKPRRVINDRDLNTGIIGSWHPLLYLCTFRQRSLELFLYCTHNECFMGAFIFAGIFCLIVHELLGEIIHTTRRIRLNTMNCVWWEKLLANCKRGKEQWEQSGSGTYGISANRRKLREIKVKW